MSPIDMRTNPNVIFNILVTIVNIRPRPPHEEM